MSGVAAGRWQKAVRDDSDLSPAARMLGLLASTWADFKTGRNMFVSQSTLASRSGRSVKTVRKAITELIEGGWLELVENRAAQGKTNLYALRMPSDPRSVETHPWVSTTPPLGPYDPTPGAVETYDQATDRSHYPSTHQATADESTDDPWADLDDEPSLIGGEVEEVDGEPVEDVDGEPVEDVDLSDAPEPWLDGDNLTPVDGALPRLAERHRQKSERPRLRNRQPS